MNAPVRQVAAVPVVPVPRWLMPIRRTVLAHRVVIVPLVGAWALLAIALGFAAGHDWYWLLALAGLIAPDLTFLAAIGDPPPAPGLMPPKAVPLYNAAHRLLPALVVVAAGAFLGSSVVLVLSLAWAAHILWDRSVGYGLRAPDGSIIGPFAFTRGRPVVQDDPHGQEPGRGLQ
ncbi:hypothetical protein BH10ACT8_BH10ACT8_22940 [soil metagenome]